MASEETDLMREVWSHVAVTAGFSGKSDVKLFLNGDLIQSCPEVNLLVTDNLHLDNYIGGIRHDWQLKDAFCGFIYEFNISNYAKSDFATTLFSTCEGECLCTEEAGTCLSHCKYDEFDRDGVCACCPGYGD